MGISERLCLGLNRVFPRRGLPGRESPRSYFEADMREADEVLAAYAPHLQLDGNVVLDGGCGLGGKTLHCARLGASYVVGLDNDIQHVNYASEFTDGRKHGNLTFVVVSLASLPLADGSVDVVLLNAVVEHILRADLWPALCECKRVLRRGGLLCALFPPWTSPSAAHIYDYIHIPWCQLLFSRRTLVNVLEKMNPAPRYGRLSYIEHFLELNGITIPEFKRLVRKVGLRPLKFHLRMIKKLQLLSHLPILNRYLASHVVAVLRKED